MAEKDGDSLAHYILVSSIAGAGALSTAISSSPSGTLLKTW